METPKKKHQWARNLNKYCLFPALAIIAITFILLKLTTEDPPPPPPPTASEMRQDSIESQFNAWNGSHVKLVRLVKNVMNDPRSFEHVSTVYEDKGDHILVYMQYRGANSFGATILDDITVKADMNGNIIEVVEQ